ncbi:MAG TPA: hypothetical protein VM661_10860 [Candidatus Sulfotelmatobacter sp.]|jgi:hypothetical protein|nr:hypothetical protein [Candidatus Sulfotelmatobacter sp.]
MNLPVPDAAGPEIVTQESLLLGAAERIGRIRDGRLAVQVHLSRLKPQNRQDGHIRIALRMLEPMVNAYRGQMFLLGDSDVVFMVKDPNPVDVENMIFKLRALFSKDPLTYDDEGDGIDHFCTWFDLGGSDYDRFVDMARTATAVARKRSRDKGSAKPASKPLDAKSLGGVLERLSSLDVTPLIQRQSSIVIRENSATAEVLFQEFFVAMFELQKALAPDVNLLANRWLFQHLSQTLDKRVLGALSQLKLKGLPPCYSLNLNISTVLSKAFDQFEAAIGDRAGISVELQVLDVLADSRGYYAVRDRLRGKGHQVVIDGMNELTLQFMDVAQFEADLYKVAWSPEMREGEHSDAVGAAVAPLGASKVMLARCDSEAAIQWGLERGIQRFQGRYVDAMLAAYTMAMCPKAAQCTLQQCIARHGVVTGALRTACYDNDMLDSSPVMRVPKARAKEA